LFDERDDGPPEARVDPRLVSALLRHAFTHHLRELERLLWLAVTTTREPFVALTKEVESELRLPAPSTGSDEVSEETVRAALAAAQGNIRHAAQKLGLKNRYVLYRMMKRFGIEASGDDT
jgi:two-component system nitrogen regulation response regulator GlnG/two-component system response regulator HydG